MDDSSLVFGNEVNTKPIITIPNLFPCAVLFIGVGGKTVGSLSWEDGKLHFKGNADLSAHRFMRFLTTM